MENETQTRERVHALLMERPGLCTAALARELDVDAGTVDHHLRRLRKAARAQREAVGREACWFATRSAYCPMLLRSIPTLRRPNVAAVARVLQEYAQAAPRLAELSGVDVGQVRWAGTALVGCGLAQRARGGQLMLAPGARVCLTKALAGERCGEWGKCPVSKTWPADAGREG